MTPFLIMFGLIGAPALLLAAWRVAALLRYGAVLEEGGVSRAWDCGLQGAYLGRRVELGFAPSGYRDRPSLFQVALASPAPIRIEASRRTLALFVRKIAGIQRDRATGDAELDRLFAFDFDERPRVTACLARPEVRESLTTLAALGAESIRLRDDLLAFQSPMTFLLPPARSRVEAILSAMRTLASGAESVPTTPAPGGSAGSGGGRAASEELAVEEAFHSVRPGGASVAGPVHLAVFSASMVAGALVLGRFWDFDGHLAWRTRLALVEGRLPWIAGIVAVTGFAAAYLLPRRAGVLGLLLSWPVLAHAGLLWILYGALQLATLPGLKEMVAGEGEFLKAVLTTGSTAAVVVFGSGTVAALLGARASWVRALGEDPAISRRLGSDPIER